MAGTDSSIGNCHAAIGVSVIAYAPYAILCWIIGIIALAFGYLNITMHKCKDLEKEEDDQQ